MSDSSIPQWGATTRLKFDAQEMSDLWRAIALAGTVLGKTEDGLRITRLLLTIKEQTS